MKKQIFVLSAALMLAFGSFAYANTLNKPVVNTPSGGEEDALYCKFTKGDTSVECWFCDCAKLKGLL